MTDILAVIPSRGGSVELRRKNLLPIDGVPMFLRSARAARDAGCQVVVSTDDTEIRSTAVVAGFDVHDRGPELADVTVDEVVKAATEGWDGPVLLLQPTVQPITHDAVAAFIREAVKTPHATAVIETTEQYMRDGEWLTQRVNRQDRTDPVCRELGMRFWANPELIGSDMTPEPVTLGWAHPLTDIDTVNDYRSVTPKREIVFWPIADDTHGHGHLRRCLAIAERLQHHHVTFYTDQLDTEAVHIVESRGWDTIPNSPYPHADLWILDRLDNHRGHVLAYVSNDDNDDEAQIMSLEDHGPGNALTAVTINALYDTEGPSIKSGVDWCVLRPEFLHGDYTVTEETRALRLMVMFGGTDPSGLGQRVSQLFPNQNVDWVKPGDDRSISEAMHDADILITSAGRTVFEAAAVGIPTIVLAQNVRETTHTHIGFGAGNVYLGLGRLVSDSVIMETVRNLEEDYDLRVELSERGRPDGKGLARIIHVIEGLLEGL